MIALALATLLNAGPMIIRKDERVANPARAVRIEMRINGYGVSGTAEMIFDRRDGHFVQQLDLGPASQSIGFDGKNAWIADATGFSANQGNVDQRSSIVAWSALFAKARPARIVGSSLQYSGLSRPFTVSFDKTTHLVTQVVVPRGNVATVIAAADYRELANGLIVPYALSFTDDSGTWSGVVTRVDTDFTPRPNTFAAPAKPNDSDVLGGVTSVPFTSGANYIIVPARIDHGPVMHFLLDTGGQNILTPEAVRRLHMHTIGGATVGGVGANVVPIRFASISSVRVGSAQIRNQPFLIIDFGKLLPGIDGLLGAELLSRFAARIDYAHETLELASKLPNDWIRNTRVAPFIFRGRQPQAEGAIDGIPAQLTIDTGSNGDLDIGAPFGRAHDLVRRLHARDLKKSNRGVGGTVKVLWATLNSLRIGSLTLSGIRTSVASASAGFSADPSFAANVGGGVFRQFTLILDYASQRLYFAPGGLHDRSGLTLVTRGHDIVVAAVHRGTEAAVAGVLTGMHLSSVNGTAVNANDLSSVREQLSGEAGTELKLVFNKTFRRHIFLENYL